jgi:signal transduction histidine kinase
MSTAAARVGQGGPGSGDPEMDRGLDLGISWTAHELRAPLLGVRAALEVVASDLETDPRRAEILRRVLVEVERLAATADAVLGWASGTRPLELRDIDVTRLVEEAIDSCRLGGADGFVLTRRPEAGAFARIDPEHVRAAIANLLRNARAYADPGTTVEIDVVADGVDVTVSVRNRGPGVEADDRERIFDPFVRTASSVSAPGIGLGLFITRKVVEAHGGRISMTSEGQDTTFRVMLPASAQALACAS